jgi:hypothetical protein
LPAALQLLEPAAFREVVPIFIRIMKEIERKKVVSDALGEALA